MNTNSTNESEKWVAGVTESFERVTPPIAERPDDRGILELIRAAERPARGGWRIGETLTPRRLLAVAAVVLMTLMLTGIWWPEGLSPQRAFAQMVDNVRTARTAVMEMVVAQGAGREAIRSKMYVRSPAQMRQEMENGKIVTVYDFDAGKMMSLIPDQKQASVVDLPKGGAGKADPSRGVVDIVAAFRELPAGRVTLAAEEVEGGRALLVYDAVDPGGDKKRVWVDKRTLLPVRLRYQGTVPGRAEPGELTFERMEWNVELDDALFAMTPPQGYASVASALAAPGPEDLVRILRLWTALADGAFPAEFTPVGMYRLANLFRDFDDRVSNGGKDRGEAYKDAYVNLARAAGMDMDQINGASTFQQQVLHTAGRGASYLAVAMEKPQWRWNGAGAKVGEKDRVVCYWKDEDGPTYTAVMATLELRKLQAADLPK